MKEELRIAAEAVTEDHPGDRRDHLSAEHTVIHTQGAGHGDRNPEEADNPGGGTSPVVGVGVVDAHAERLPGDPQDARRGDRRHIAGTERHRDRSIERCDSQAGIDRGGERTSDDTADTPHGSRSIDGGIHDEERTGGVDRPVVAVGVVERCGQHLTVEGEPARGSDAREC